MKILWVLIILIIGVGGIYWYYQNKKNGSMFAVQPQWIAVIPGVTGDLAKRKLIPVLYSLFKKGNQGIIIGTGRRDTDISHVLKESIRFVKDWDASTWNKFSELISYQKLDPKSEDDFKALAQSITNLEKTKNLSGKRLMYLSLPPDVFCSLSKLAVRTGLVVPGKEHYLIFEKPFGWNSASAKELNDCLTALLPERQLYRVDHYVAKGLVQSLPYLAQTNPLLARAWNGNFIDQLSVRFHETVGVEGRGEFYDRYGAIKDVVQNHMLQLLAFCAVDPLQKQSSQQQKVAFLQSLSVREVHRGQYEGYSAEKGVAPQSTTETSATILLESSQPHWKGVQFLLETGKAFADKVTDLRVRFKPTRAQQAQELVIQFAPEEKIDLSFHGLGGELIGLKSRNFHYPEAYEALFDDVLSGRLQYAVSYQEIEAQWRLTDDILARAGVPTVYRRAH